MGLLSWADRPQATTLGLMGPDPQAEPWALCHLHLPPLGWG